MGIGSFRCKKPCKFMKPQATSYTIIQIPGWRDKVSHSAKFRIFSYLAGNAFPSGLLRAAPQRPLRHSLACRETESAYPAAPGVANRLWLLQPLSGAFRKTGTGGGIPARPSFPDRSNCLRDRLVAGPEPHGLPPPIGDPPVGGGGASEATMSLPATKRCPRHFALSGVAACPLASIGCGPVTGIRFRNSESCGVMRLAKILSKIPTAPP